MTLAVVAYDLIRIPKLLRRELPDRPSVSSDLAIQKIGQSKIK